jgi:hypothetical protein
MGTIWGWVNADVEEIMPEDFKELLRCLWWVYEMI